jgi:2-succinyl-6-hydroxy-2,4-cyclohexadiene-1-carboxylate synthase
MKIVCRDVEYHVEIAGTGEPLLLLHGFTGNAATWSFLIPLLSVRYKLIMVDIIGHGLTDSPDDISRYTMKEVAFDLKEILDGLDIQKTHVLGYSMGGRLALSFACLFPESVRGLLLESASPGLRIAEERQERRLNDKRLAENILESGIAAFVERWGNIPLFSSQKRLPEKKQVAIRQQRLTNSEKGLANSLIGMGTGSQTSWWDTLTHLNMPVLLLVGELDEKFCTIAKSMQLLMKNCDLEIISDAGHAIHVEKPLKFGKMVSVFLAKGKGGDIHGN